MASTQHWDVCNFIHSLIQRLCIHINPTEPVPSRRRRVSAPSDGIVRPVRPRPVPTAASPCETSPTVLGKAKQCSNQAHVEEELRASGENEPKPGSTATSKLADATTSLIAQASRCGCCVPVRLCLHSLGPGARLPTASGGSLVLLDLDAPSSTSFSFYRPRGQ